MQKVSVVLTNLSNKHIHNVETCFIHPFIIKSAKVLCINAKKEYLNMQLPLILILAMHTCIHPYVSVSSCIYWKKNKSLPWLLY